LIARRLHVAGSLGRSGLERRLGHELRTHAVAAWRRSEVPLSQWELSERGDSLVAANKLAETLGRDGAKEQLSKLLNFTEKVSRGKARWQER